MTSKVANAKAPEIKWLPDVEAHDYPAAESYLLIIYSADSSLGQPQPGYLVKKCSLISSK
jgi:hypothetical protein